MKLGLKRDEVKLVQFDNQWHGEFLRVKREMMELLNIDDKRIEHIGSTAINGMMAKPILDIAIAVDNIHDLDEAFLNGLREIGFLKLRVIRPGEIVFAKFTDDTHEEKTHYIHVVDYGKDLWKDLIFFRDYLNSRPSEMEEYKNIKLEYVKNSNRGINEYTDHKEDFVKRVYKKREKEV